MIPSSKLVKNGKQIMPGIILPRSQKTGELLKLPRYVPDMPTRKQGQRLRLVKRGGTYYWRTEASKKTKTDVSNVQRLRSQRSRKSDQSKKTKTTLKATKKNVEEWKKNKTSMDIRAGKTIGDTKRKKPSSHVTPANKIGKSRAIAKKGKKSKK